jgi:hypothetical protein
MAWLLAALPHRSVSKNQSTALAFGAWPILWKLLHLIADIHDKVLQVARLALLILHLIADIHDKALQLARITPDFHTRLSRLRD